MPGRIIARSSWRAANPVILLDEVDKLTTDAHGDPTSALLEVLDTDQSKQFRDHFIELPVDLSECLFIATANTAETIRAAAGPDGGHRYGQLFGRRKSSPSPKPPHFQAVETARADQAQPLVYRRRCRRSSAATPRSRASAIWSARSPRSAARSQGTSSPRGRKRTAWTNRPSPLLGPEKFLEDRIYPQDEIGIVNGLAWTSLGGELLRVEVLSMQGNGNLELTGHLGDVMKESARAAVSYIRKHAESLGVDPDFYKNARHPYPRPEGRHPEGRTLRRHCDDNGAYLRTVRPSRPAGCGDDRRDYAHRPRAAHRRLEGKKLWPRARPARRR